MPIGCDFLCAAKQFRQLSDTNLQQHEWCIALLKGVFGADAPYMRTKVTKLSCPRSKVFPPNFCDTAKGNCVFKTSKVLIAGLIVTTST